MLAPGWQRVSLTDHDTTAEWARRLSDWRMSTFWFSAGAGFSCRYRYTDKVWVAHAETVTCSLMDVGRWVRVARRVGQIRASRKGRAQAVCASAADYPLTWDDVLAQVGSTRRWAPCADAGCRCGATVLRLSLESCCIRAAADYVPRACGPLGGASGCVAERAGDLHQIVRCVGAALARLTLPGITAGF